MVRTPCTGIALQEIVELGWDNAKLRECEVAAGIECKTFARQRTIKWKNGINPGKGKASRVKSKWTRDELVAKLTELGFVGSN